MSLRGQRTLGDIMKYLVIFISTIIITLSVSTNAATPVSPAKCVLSVGFSEHADLNFSYNGLNKFNVDMVKVNSTTHKFTFILPLNSDADSFIDFYLIKDGQLFLGVRSQPEYIFKAPAYDGTVKNVWMMNTNIYEPISSMNLRMSVPVTISDLGRSEFSLMNNGIRSVKISCYQ